MGQRLLMHFVGHCLKSIFAGRQTWIEALDYSSSFHIQWSLLPVTKVFGSNYYDCSLSLSLSLSLARGHLSYM